MCSNNTCDEIKFDSDSKILFRAKCRKWDEQLAKIVLQRKFPYCRECFLIYFSHKYNGGLGKLKLLRRGDKVLVAFSGSPYGVCLINLIFQSLIADRKKKTKFEVEVIFIDERWNISKEERREIHLSINNLLSCYE